MSESSGLRIHAALKPGAEADGQEKHVRSGPIRINAKSGRPRRARRLPRRKLTPGDRLLRNSAIACAALLGVLALGNVEAPWAQRASETVENALTMHIDLDESIGALTFVREIMPESALVFLNISGETGPARPVEGTLAHPWSSLQPWQMYKCDEGSAVYAAQAGTVTAVSPLSEGKYGVLVDHGNGRESVYASLTEVSVHSGDAVERGRQLGTADGGVYFELRQAGESVDPAEALGL